MQQWQPVSRAPRPARGEARPGMPCNLLGVAGAHAWVQTAEGRSCSPTFGMQGDIHDTSAFCPIDGGRARNSGDCLFLKQLAFIGKRRQPWHRRRAQPRGNDRKRWTLGSERNGWHWGRDRPGWPEWPEWDDRKWRDHTTGNGRSEWDWRTHGSGKRWRGHGGAVGLGRGRGRGSIDRYGRHDARRFGW